MTFKSRRRMLILVVLAISIGFCVTILTGFVENKPSEIGIPENKYYGFPMIWRTSDPFRGEKILYTEFFVDYLFWTIITAILIAALVKLQALL